MLHEARRPLGGVLGRDLAHDGDAGQQLRVEPTQRGRAEHQVAQERAVDAAEQLRGRAADGPDLRAGRDLVVAEGVGVVAEPVREAGQPLGEAVAVAHQRARQRRVLGQADGQDDELHRLVVREPVEPDDVPVAEHRRDVGQLVLRLGREHQQHAHPRELREEPAPQPADVRLVGPQVQVAEEQGDPLGPLARQLGEPLHEDLLDLLDGAPGLAPLDGDVHQRVLGDDVGDPGHQPGGHLARAGRRRPRPAERSCRHRRLAAHARAHAVHPPVELLEALGDGLERVGDALQQLVAARLDHLGHVQHRPVAPSPLGADRREAVEQRALARATGAHHLEKHGAVAAGPRRDRGHQLGEAVLLLESPDEDRPRAVRRVLVGRLGGVARAGRSGGRGCLGARIAAAPPPSHRGANLRPARTGGQSGAHRA